MPIRYTDEAANVEQLYELYEDLGWNEYLKLSPEVLHRAIMQSGITMNAYNGDQLVGTGRVITDGYINAYLCGVGVQPDYQRQGIGSELINRLVQKCKETNLHVQLFCSEDNMPFYHKFDFKEFAIGMKLS
ncbi:GNAT family N-acetyltransferase [Paenibacillus albiflavus]|uniref:GNAT family N-acetyltransferase n=1 Tax=Paenibacillus albiflavus TaxID=2545760 RepID=A0A4V2WPG4_9BACL|nr:GNAT family N-acetyltransferase [Paenibacillus albiflavus]TCZ79272.1 GNAT family N-acetyltransferase [Paenibacillus albiflavus]